MDTPPPVAPTPATESSDLTSRWTFGYLIFIVVAAVLVPALALSGVEFYPAFRRGMNTAFFVTVVAMLLMAARDWRHRRRNRGRGAAADARAI